MKLKNLLGLFCIISILSFFISCSDSDDDAQVFPGGTSAKLLPVKAEGEKKTYCFYYEYDNNNRLLSEKIAWTESNYATYKINYGTDGNIDKMTYDYFEDGKIIEEGSHSLTYTYNGSQIKVNNSKRKLDKWLIEVDDQGRILESKTIFSGDKEYIYTTTYEYSDGNIKRADGVDYSYDNKNGIFKYVNTPQWFLVSQLNIMYFLKNNATEFNQILEERNSETKASGTTPGNKITYTYNSNGYPAKYTPVNFYLMNNGAVMPENYFLVEYKLAN